MRQKITITLDDDLIAFAKEYARTHKTSISDILNRYLAEAKVRVEVVLKEEA